LVDMIISNPFDDFGIKKKEEEETTQINQGVDDPFKDLNISRPPTAPKPAPVSTELEVDDPFVDLGVMKQAPTSLSVEDVANDEERLSKIRKMMSTTKDIYYETAPAEEVMDDFMAHMRWLNTNEASTAVEALNIAAADDEKKAIYGEAYKVYDEMGSIFSNGDAWNGVVDYGAAFVTSPSLWLGLGIGKIAGAAGTKAASKAAQTAAINAATKEIVKKSGGRLASETVKSELKSTAAKAAARYHIAGALAAEAPLALSQDYLLQDIRMDTGVQDEFSFLQSVVSTVAGGFSAIPAIYTLRKSAGSTLGDTGRLLDESYKIRAQTSAKRAAPRVKASLEKASTDWAKLAEAGKGMPTNPALDKAISDWFFGLDNEDSLFRIIVSEGADLNVDSPRWTEEIIGYAMNMGDEALKDFNKALEPLNITFGEATERIANAMKFAGETFNPASQAKRFYNEFRNVSVAKRNAVSKLAENLGEEVADGKVVPKQVASYIQSTWKRMLVSTWQTTAVNVKGWMIARAAGSLADITAAGGLLGRAGIRAVIDPAGAVQDAAKAKALIQNQTFALQTLIDPYLSREAFIELLDRAPKKIQRRVTGQIFGGVDDFGPERFGLDPKTGMVKVTESVSDFAQRISFVHLQDSLTKGISGLTALDKETRLAFGRGIEDIIKTGDAWRITDEMWERVSRSVLRDTFSEDLTKGNTFLSNTADFIEKISNHPVGGFVIPFGRFMNNTMAFMYRNSPLGYLPVMGSIFKGEAKDDLGERAARATVGTMALLYLWKDEGEKQEQGLQWNQRRNTDGSVEDITNLFPYSVYALIGRISHNLVRGEGMDQDLVASLLQQVGPLEALESLSAPTFVKDFTRWVTDQSIPEEEKASVLSSFGDWGVYVGAQAAEIAAGFTRPLGTLSSTVSYQFPEAGGGVATDRKQAEGFDQILMGFSRYTSSIFNYLLGEETEYGVRLYGEPKEAATSEGPVMMPNPAAAAAGGILQAPQRNLNKLLAMVDKPAFKADSFTSGNAQYDAFINKHVTPLLEARAKALMETDVFKKAPQSGKIKLVDDMLSLARQDVVGLLEGRRIGDAEMLLVNERRKLLTRDRAGRRRAMKALNITTDENKLSLFEIEAIRRYMDFEKEEYKSVE
jgi:tetratricopeptide (TPR) repeat protein